MLSTAEILNLIRLTELEIRKLNTELEGDDVEKSNDAAQVIIQFHTMAEKLKNMYIDSSPDYDTYPSYE